MVSSSVGVSQASERPALGTRTTDAYRYALSLMVVLLAATLDIPNFLDRGNYLRYLLLLIPVLTIVLLRAETRSVFIKRPMASDRILLVLLLFGLPGTIYGVVFLGSSSTARSIFLPMATAFLYLFPLDDISDREAASLLRIVGWIAFLYTALNAFVNAGLGPELRGFLQYRNASFFFVPMALAAAIVLKRWMRVSMLLAMVVFIYLTYPAGTSVLVVVTTVLTFVMTPRRTSTLRPYLVALLVAVGIAIALLNFTKGVALTERYFDLVGKPSANQGRLALWTAGLDRFQQSPIFGDAFSKGTVTDATRIAGTTADALPYHNDYVLFLAAGGIVGLGLLVGWIVATVSSALRRYQALLSSGEHSKAAFLRVLLVGYNAFFVSAAFNPSMEGVSRAASIFAVYSLMMAIGLPRNSSGLSSQRHLE
jgi:O-antigen ligase